MKIKKMQQCSLKKNPLRILALLVLFPVITIYGQSEFNPRADSAVDAYNAAFLVTSGDQHYYKEALNQSRKDYFWRQALDILGIEDIYLRTKDPDHKTLIANLLDTFLRQNGTTNWDWNDYNDDLDWAGLAFAKGYQITGDTAYLRMATYAFNRLYDRGWDMELGGGIWWDVRHSDKSGLSNNPSVQLACYIYEATHEEEYLTKAIGIYEWIVNTLYNKTNGAVYENIKPDGRVSTSANTYNVGAFIGAANHLHRLTGRTDIYEDAQRSVDYIMKIKFNNGIMTSGQRQGTSQSEFSRGMGEFVRDNNLWSTYYDWMKRNADASWNIRRRDLNLSWCSWTRQMPEDDITTAVECIGTPIHLSITPVTEPGFDDDVPYRFAPKINNASALSIEGASASDGAKTEINRWIGDNSQIFTAVSLGTGYYRLVPAHAPGKSLTVSEGTIRNDTLLEIRESNNDSTQYWKLAYDYNDYYKLKPKCAPTRCLTVTAMANGTKCILGPEQFEDNERWQILPPTTGISSGSVKQKTGVTLYFNRAQKTLIVPSSNLLTDVTYSIFDAKGKKLLRGKPTGSKIDLSALQSGIYFIKLSGKEFSLNKKFML